MPEYVLDAVALRVMAFAHPRGIEFLLAALGEAAARFPGEVYNRDEDALPLEQGDEALSEFARGLRHARRQAAILPPERASRYRRWLQNALQLGPHLDRGTLVVEIPSPSRNCLTGKG